MSPTLTPVFDIGGVFIEWNPLHLYRKMFPSEKEAQWFVANICTPAWNLSLDAGVPYAEAVTERCARFPRFWREIQAYDTRWEEMVPHLYEDTIAIHAHLVEQGIKTYAITNFSAEKWVQMLPKWAFMQRFEGVVVSGVEKLVKPDWRIYELFCGRFNLQPEQCLFFDDNPANVAAAKQAGLVAELYVDAPTLAASLRAHGFEIPTVQAQR